MREKKSSDNIRKHIFNNFDCKNFQNRHDYCNRIRHENSSI